MECYIKKRFNGKHYFVKPKTYYDIARDRAENINGVLEKLFYDGKVLYLGPNPKRKQRADPDFTNDFVFRLLYHTKYVMAKVGMIRNILDNIIKEGRSVQDVQYVNKKIVEAGNLSRELLRNDPVYIDGLYDRIDYNETMVLLSFVGIVERFCGLVDTIRPDLDRNTLDQAYYVTAKVSEHYYNRSPSINNSFRFRFVFLWILANCSELQCLIKPISNLKKFNNFIGDLSANAEAIKCLPSHHRKRWIVATFVFETFQRYQVNKFLPLMKDAEIKRRNYIFPRFIVIKNNLDDKHKKPEKRKKNDKRKKADKRKKNGTAIKCSSVELKAAIKTALETDSLIPIETQQRLANTL